MIAIIPARGGSKRIPHKNVRPFIDGTPIINYPIATARESWLFDDIVVSSDSGLIGDWVRQLDVSIHRRSEYAASDEAETEDVIAEVLAEYPGHDKCCVLYPTSVFVRAVDLISATGRKEPSVFAITRVRGNIERSMARDNGEMSFIFDDHNGNSQQYRETYFDAGQFYMLDTAAFLEAWENGIRIPEMTPNFGHIIPYAVDINEPSDWSLAEAMYRSFYAS